MIMNPVQRFLLSRLEMKLSTFKIGKEGQILCSLMFTFLTCINPLGTVDGYSSSLRDATGPVDLYTVATYRQVRKFVH